MVPLNPRLHPAYVRVLWPEPGKRDPLPPDVREEVDALLRKADTCPEEELEAVYAQIVSATWWYALRPDEIARRTIQHHGLPRPGRPMTVAQAALVLAAIGEAGYPITGNGAPDYAWETRQRCGDPWLECPVLWGPERTAVIWAAAEYWARMAAEPLTYVSLGDCRGYLPRPVQYDQPGTMHPSQRAALTLGPWSEREAHDYVRRHTRLLLLVRD